MSNQLLIVARMRPESAPRVADLFAASDESELPAALGVLRRDLFCYHDLYFHAVEFATDSAPAMARARHREDFRQLSAELEASIAPYDPSTWRSPADAMARRFYGWTTTGGRAEL